MSFGVRQRKEKDFFKKCYSQIDLQKLLSKNKQECLRNQDKNMHLSQEQKEEEAKQWPHKRNRARRER